MRGCSRWANREAPCSVVFCNPTVFEARDGVSSAEHGHGRRGPRRILCACARCRNSIPLGRLEIMPEARVCVGCAER
ncbi:MAG: TraR/DksA C4-type zinc finger protein [Bacteroidetes bacterium]|nr:TraR/DksA C4-type zinc finger protein [Bacteroidota bacterium]